MCPLHSTPGGGSHSSTVDTVRPPRESRQAHIIREERRGSGDDTGVTRCRWAWHQLTSLNKAPYRLTAQLE